jgi:hypothetical protein
MADQGAVAVTPRAVLRVLRPAVFAAVCLAITVAGHQMEGGHPVGPVAVGTGFAALYAAAAVAGDRQRSTGAVTAAMLVGQVGLHLLFSHGDAMTPGMAPGMVGVHAAIAVLAGWWLSRGDAACWRWVRRAESATLDAIRWALRHLCAGLHVPVSGFRARRPWVRVDGETADGRTLLRARCEPRRGPPCAPAPAVF